MQQCILVLAQGVVLVVNNAIQIQALEPLKAKAGLAPNIVQDDDLERPGGDDIQWQQP